MKKTKGWVLAGVGLLAAACGGKQLRNVGELNGEAGASESPGSPQTPGAGGKPAAGPESEVFAVGTTDVVGITASATTLYWVERGSSDELGNYQHDGRLVARDFDSEDTRVVAEDLPGPTGLWITTEHALVHVDRVFNDGGLQKNALLRIALTGGNYDVVSWGASRQRPLQFAHDGNIGYFPHWDDGYVYRLEPDEAEASVYLPQPASSLTIHQGSLYVGYFDGVWEVPLATGTPQQLSTEERHQIRTNGDFVYGIEYLNDGQYLSRMPLDGGPWVRLPPKHTTTNGWQLMMLDELFFFDGFDDEQRRHITHGTLADPDAAKTAVALGTGSQHVWVGTAHGIFVNESSRILRVPLALE
jgi:hypothetical protein